MDQLPNFQDLKVSQSSQSFSRKTIGSLDHLLIVLPKKPHTKLFRKLPQGTQLERIFRRSKIVGSKVVTSRLNNQRDTGIVISTYTDKSTFQRLTWARKLMAECLKNNPGTLGISTIGLSKEEKRKVIVAIVAAAEAAVFKLPEFKSVKKSRSRILKQLKILDAQPRIDLSEVRASSLGNNVARWLTALPPNELNAKTYRRMAEQLAKKYGIESEFFGEQKLKKLGAGAFLAVAQGNPNRDAGILRLSYRPKKQDKPDLALVGKGILFDTGGTNLKPFKSMLDMHKDMQGSAVALGTLIALSKLQVTYAIDAWLAITENRISGTAYKSQDVVRAVNGMTIQVIHTDAEGRMVLADTLALAARENPDLIIDYATLTGSCVVALTERYSGAFSNREELAAQVALSGKKSGERIWSFPMDEDYDEDLFSSAADIKQCAATGYGDHILAARFLSKFVPDSIPWVHLDLSAGQHKGGLAHIPSDLTGFGVRLTVDLLQHNQMILKTE